MLTEKQILVAHIKLINVCTNDKDKIRGILLSSNIHNSRLKYIKSITAHNEESFLEIDGRKILGLATIHHIDGNIDYGTIDIVSSKLHPGLEPDREFENTLNHEIAHIAFSTESIIEGCSEELACDYANKEDTINMIRKSQCESVESWIACIVGILILIFFNPLNIIGALTIIIPIFGFFILVIGIIDILNKFIFKSTTKENEKLTLEEIEYLQ